MITLHHLARLGLATALLLVFTSGKTEQQTEVPAGMGARADVDRPKPTFMLHERDKRVHGLKPFQDLVDKAPAGSVLKPPPGNYAGPVVINKPLTIDGGGKVSIDAGDRGTVMVLNASNSVVRGLHLTGSGDSHDTDDSCLDVRGDQNLIENIEIDNCLFGLDFKQSNKNIIRGNTIRSKDRDLGVRGDGLRLWYSNDNLIEKNQIIDSRDMYTEGGLVRDNIISHATGATGMGIGFKEASGTIIENNEIIYCGIGIGSDLSPFQPDSTIEIRNNRFAYNGTGILFNSETGGNNMIDNVFEGNLTQVA